MKNYYQSRRSRFRLPHEIYRAMRGQMACYNYYSNRIRDYKEMSEDKITESDTINMLVAEKYVNIIDDALKEYVPDEFQKAVFEHVINGVEYEDIQDIYFYPAGTMKPYTQAFVYGVARLLGEDFSD